MNIEKEAYEEFLSKLTEEGKQRAKDIHPFYSQVAGMVFAAKDPLVGPVVHDTLLVMLRAVIRDKECDHLCDVMIEALAASNKGTITNFELAYELKRAIEEEGIEIPDLDACAAIGCFTVHEFPQDLSSLCKHLRILSPENTAAYIYLHHDLNGRHPYTSPLTFFDQVVCKVEDIARKRLEEENANG